MLYRQLAGRARAYVKVVIPKPDHVSQFLGIFVKTDTLEILIQEVWGRVQVSFFFQFFQVISKDSQVRMHG